MYDRAKTYTPSSLSASNRHMTRISRKPMTGILCAVVAAVALCLAPADAAGAGKHPDTKSADTPSRDVPHAAAQKIRVPGVANFGEVTPTLFRGAQPTERGFENLSKMGIAIVVDLREGGEVQREEKEVTANGMKFVAISWNCRDPKDEYFAKFLTLLRENPGKKVFVHCHAGVDRTGMMIASYRMADQGWTAEESLQEMKSFGLSMFHRVICSPIESYEAKFPSVLSTNAAFQFAQKAAAAAPPSATVATAVPPKQ